MVLLLKLTLRRPGWMYANLRQVEVTAVNREVGRTVVL